MNTYRVNINDLFDQDEEFLFENPYFCALIRKIKKDFEYLVNPIFDLEEILQKANPVIDAKYSKSATEGWSPQMNQGELIQVFQQTFNTPSIKSRLAYDKMIEKYDEFFDKEKKNAERRLTALMSGRQIHDLITQVLEFYEARERNRHKISVMDESIQIQLKETKKQLDQFVDGLIETLNNEFNEKTVTVYSSRKDKLAMLQKLSNELDQDTYHDTEQLMNMISQNQEDLLNANIGGEKQPFLPKPDLRFREYSAIKNMFSGADFERNSFVTLSLPLVSAVMWFFQRVGRKMKWM